VGGHLPEYLLDGSKRPVFFIVFGHQRTGSTLLASRLNSHPRICCHDEVFLPWVHSGPSLKNWLKDRGLPGWLRVMPNVRASFLISLFDFNSVAGDIGAVGFKLMYNQMSLWPKFSYIMPRASQILRDPALRSWLRTNQVLVIHMLRRNHLKILVSHELAARSGLFHSRDAHGRAVSLEDRKVLIPLPGLKTRLHRIELAEKAARNNIVELPSIEIWYEDYVSAGGALDDTRLCNALGQSVPVGGLTSPLSKVSSDNLRDTIANYEQVAAHLAGTRFARFLV
jgi:LPS sulfotransferase NodH